ncbi:nuclear transport factor 2 family protein [Limibacter armeniacum]|uniref:nuclear transport factor 2 family protein n=1 Tax=Limibacter armeniacum TaxID=466084 RepID=UPI002FE5A414
MEDQKNIIERYIQAYNKFDINGMIQFLHTDIEFENISGGETDTATKGIAAFKELAEASKQYFVERHQSVTSWKFEEDKVTVQIDYHGILAMDLPSGAKKGDAITMIGQSVFTFKDGLIVKIQDIS